MTHMTRSLRQKPTFCINWLKCGTLSAQPYIYHHFSTLYCTNHNARLVKSGHKLAFEPCQSHLSLRVSAFNLPFAGGHLSTSCDFASHLYTVLWALGLQLPWGHAICPQLPFPIAFRNARALWPRDFGVWQCQNRRNQHIDRSLATRASCRNPSAKDLQPGCQLITTCPYTDIAMHFR